MKKQFKEAFLRADIERALFKISKVLSSRIGTKLRLSSLPMDVIKMDGRKLSGLIATFKPFGQIRYNWYTKDTSSHIVSVDIWFKLKNPLKPDVEVEVKGMNAKQIIDAVEFAFMNIGDRGVIFDERAISVEGNTKAVSQAFKDSINQWSVDMSVDDDKIMNNRISDLYKDYQYWYREVNTNESLPEVSGQIFRNYLVSYLAKYGLTNIFMRSIIKKQGTKEKIITTDTLEQKKFDKVIYGLSLSDTFGLIERDINSVIQGYKTAAIICGKAGTGKTEIVKNALEKNKSVKVKYLKGGVTKPLDLYKMLYQNNSSKTIIVMDDFDTPFAQYKKFEGLIKAMLDSNMRIVSYLDAKTGGKLPDSFILESKFIIISNLPKARIPEPVYSRAVPNEVKASASDMLDYLNMNLDGIFPDHAEITKQVKQEVLDFLGQYVRDIVHLDFRIFKQAIIYRVTNPADPNWKKYVLAMVTRF